MRRSSPLPVPALFTRKLTSLACSAAAAIEAGSVMSSWMGTTPSRPDILTARLNTLVSAGVPYQEPGTRQRFEYRLTAAGRELQVVLGALQQWGDEHDPYPPGPTYLRRSSDGRPLRVALVDDRGQEVPLPDVRMIKTAAHPDLAGDGQPDA